MKSSPTKHHLEMIVNGHRITQVLIGRHYLIKHSSYMNDRLILDLVITLNGRNFLPDSSTDGVEYFVADIQLESNQKTYRIIWLFEGENLEVLGVINAYRRKRKEK